MTYESAVATAITVAVLSVFLFFRWLIKKLLEKKFQKDYEIDIARNRKELINGRVL
jgi:hypothetical protein